MNQNLWLQGSRWMNDPIGYANLTEEDRKFLEDNDIIISAAYIGMVRAYRRNEKTGYSHVIWQTSYLASVWAAMNQTSISYDDLAEQLRSWVTWLRNLSKGGLERVFDNNIGLLDK